MEISIGSRKWRLLVALCTAVAGLSLLFAACGDDDDGDTAAAGADVGQSGPIKCGLGNGKKATGTPIKLGGIATKQPGTDFSDGLNAANAYFKCVNDNGGINGRPIQYFMETEQTDPAQDASLVRKLAESDKVIGFTGGFSLIECSVNHAYYEQHGFYVLNAGIAPECWSTPNSAPVNMGPRYSSDGAVQYVLRQDVDKIVFEQSNVPGTGYIAEGPQLLADDAGVPIVQLTENVPIQDANSVALKLVQEAGENGAVVLNFTPPEALKILQAAEQQGLAEQVKAWGCSTPCNTDFLAEALGTSWDDRLGVNAELNVTDFDGPDSELYRQVMEKYGQDVTGGLGSFSQMGYLMGRISVQALLSIEGDEYTVETYNEAVRNVKNFETDILCEPWYYGKAPLHIPNHTDWTTTPSGGKMVIKEDCFDISNVEPDIKRVEQIEAADPSLVGK